MAKKHPKHPPYVPIIKWQEWEQRALKATSLDVARHVLPCVEVRDSKQHVTLMARLSDTWARPSLIDYANPHGRLTGDRANELTEFLCMACRDGLPISPVLHPLDASGLPRELAKEVDHFPEVTIRLRPIKSQVSQEQVSQVQKALQHMGGHEKASRLIVDLATTPNSLTTIEIAALAAGINRLNALGFDHVYLASGAFPETLRNIASVGTPARRDWELWKQVNALGTDLYLGYADYGPLAPSWTEEILDRRGGRVTIRYARDSDWLVLRADGKTRAHSIAISELMIGPYKSSFKGATFSFGDQLIAERADPSIPEKKKLAGNYHITEYWTHHMAMVVKEQY